MPEHFVHHKNTFTQGELEAKTFQKSQNVFVKCRIMKSLSAKPSLLHFLCWKSCSLRAGFTKQTPSLTLPCVLAVCCETELLCGTLKWLDCRVNLNAMIFHLLLFQMSFPVPCLELEQVGKQGGTQVTPECKCNLVLACHNKNNKRSCPCQLKHVSTSFTISCMKKGTLQWNCQHKFSRPFERSNQATSSNRRTCLRKNSFWEPWFSCLLFDSLALFFLVMLIATGLTQVQEGEERVDKATSRRLAKWSTAEGINGLVPFVLWNCCTWLMLKMNVWKSELGTIMLHCNWLQLIWWQSSCHNNFNCNLNCCFRCHCNGNCCLLFCVLMSFVPVLGDCVLLFQICQSSPPCFWPSLAQQTLCQQQMSSKKERNDQSMLLPTAQHPRPFTQIHCDILLLRPVSCHSTALWVLALNCQSVVSHQSQKGGQMGEKTLKQVLGGLFGHANASQQMQRDLRWWESKACPCLCHVQGASHVVNAATLTFVLVVNFVTKTESGQCQTDMDCWALCIKEHSVWRRCNLCEPVFLDFHLPFQHPQLEEQLFWATGWNVKAAPPPDSLNPQQAGNKSSRHTPTSSPHPQLLQTSHSKAWESFDSLFCKKRPLKTCSTSSDHLSQVCMPRRPPRRQKGTENAFWKSLKFAWNDCDCCWFVLNLARCVFSVFAGHCGALTLGFEARPDTLCSHLTSNVLPFWIHHEGSIRGFCE